MSYFGVGRYVKGHYCNTVSKSIYLALYKQYSGRGFLVSLPSDILKYKELLDMKIEYKLLDKHNEDEMIREIERICNSDKTWDELFEEAMPYDYVQSPVSQEYEVVDVYSPVPKDIEYYKTERGSRAEPYYVTSSDDDESSASSESESEENVLIREKEQLKNGLRQIRNLNIGDSDQVIAEKLDLILEKLRLTQRSIGSVFAQIYEKLYPLRQRDYPLSYGVLRKVEEIRDKFMNKNGGGHRHKHRFTQCKKHSHCRYCGRKHH